MASSESPGMGEAPPVDSGLRPLARSVYSTFAIPPNEEQLFSPLTKLTERISNVFAEVGITLRSNLAGLLSTVSMPYTMAHSSALDFHWQRIHSAARIRSLMTNAEPGEAKEALDLRRDREALVRAKVEMDEFIHSTAGKDVVIAHTLLFLERSLSVESFVGAANELILQGVVLCWGAFEVLARDCFTTYLNANPGRSLALLADSVAKKRFELSKVSLETLAAHNFDLSGSMGTFLAKQQDLSDVYSVKAVYQALFPDEKELREALNGPDLRLLALRRNLIVHQRGIIDELFLTSTDCCQPAGEKLKLSTANLEAHVMFQDICHTWACRK